MDVWSHEERTCERISQSSTSDKEDHREKAKVVRHGTVKFYCIVLT